MAIFEVSADQTVTRYGHEIVHLSEKDFEKLLKGKSNCFICGQPAKRNKEHIIPAWIISRCKLHDEKMNLPKGLNHRFSTYTVPCCISCNSTLARELEEPISKAFASGFVEVRKLAEQLDPRLYAWLNFLYLKTHYKDLFVVPPNDHRLGAASLGDSLQWKKFRNPHAILRAYIFGTYISCSAIGSMKVLRVEDSDRYQTFTYMDAYDKTCLYIRIGDIALICAIDDFGACKYFLEPFHKELGEQVTLFQSLALLNEYELAGRRLFGRWTLAQECGLSSGSITLEGDVREPMGMRACNEQLRRDGLAFHVRPFLEQNSFQPETVNLHMSGISSGAVTYIPQSAMQTLDAVELDADWQFLREPQVTGANTKARKPFAHERVTNTPLR